MNRGDIYWCDFEPAIGHEIQKLRPAIIISNNLSNQFTGVIQVIPLTSNITNVYKSECLIKTPMKSSKALSNQITTIDKTRVKDFISTITHEETLALEKAIKIQLGLI